jgi:hypothetical protein
MLLAKDPETSPLPSAPSGGGAAASDPVSTEPVVAVASTTDAKRHVLGDSKDPFRPKVKAKPAQAGGTAVASRTTQTVKNAPSTGKGSGGSAVTGGSTPSGGSTVTGGSSTPVSTTPAPKKRTFPGDSLTVRFSSGETDSGAKSVLEKDHGLPEETEGEDQPLLIYLGLAKGGKEALFLVDASLTADGDGRCEGDGSSDCATLHLRAGDTEFFDILDEKGQPTESYQLDLLAIHPSKATKAAAAKAAKARASKAAKAAVVSVAGAASTGGGAQLGAGVGALLGSL